MAQGFERAERLEREAARERVNNIIRRNHGLAKTAALTAAGVSYKMILTLVERGELVRAKSGYYTLPDVAFSEEEAIVARFGDGVLTMGTALYYHGYLVERPAVWSIAVSKNISKSKFKLAEPPIQPYFCEENVLSLGVEKVEIAGERMKIYTVDRLVCDVLKYRERLSAEEFRQAVRAYIEDENKDVGKLWEYAAERRVLRMAESILGTWIALPDEEGTMGNVAVKSVPPKGKYNKEEKKGIGRSRQREESALGVSRKSRMMGDARDVLEDSSDNSMVRMDKETDNELTDLLDDKVEVQLPTEETLKEKIVSANDGTKQIAKHPEAESVNDSVSSATTGGGKISGDVNKIANAVFAILRQMELIEDMGVFVELYDLLQTETVDGMAVSRRLIEICEDEDFLPDEARVKKIHGWSVDRFMEQKWEKYLKRQENLSISWTKVIEKLSTFIVPIGLSMAAGQPFIGDWMPEIGRFLE